MATMCREQELTLEYCTAASGKVDLQEKTGKFGRVPKGEIQQFDRWASYHGDDSVACQVFFSHSRAGIFCNNMARDLFITWWPGD